MDMLRHGRGSRWQMALLLGALALGGCGDDDGGGSGGASGAGEGGSAGMAGEGGSAGTAGEGGTSGEGGTAGMAGEGGTAGTAGEGGTAGTAGEGGTAGTAGEGGTAGTAGEGGTAGTAGEGGTGGTSFPTEPLRVALSDGHDRLYGVTFDAEGNIYAVGQSAETIDATADYALLVAKFSPDGELDESFGDMGAVTINTAVGGTNRELARGIVIQGNRIVICGESEHDPDAADAWARRDTDIVLVRMNIDGELDETFGDEGVLRLDLTTALEGTDNGGNPEAVGRDTHYSLSLAPGGKLVVHGTQRGEGDRTGMPGVPRTDNDWVLVRLTQDGGLDSTFSGDGKVTLDIVQGNASARIATVLSDGSIIGVGYTSTTALGTISNAQQPVLYKVLSNGSFDATFATQDMWSAPGVWHDFATPDGRNAEAYGAALQGDHLVTMGYGPSPTANNNTTDWVSFRFDDNGAQELSYGDSGATYIDAGGYGDNGRAVIVMPDGRVLGIGGGRPTPSTPPAMPNQAPTDAMLVMLTEDGAPDTTFALGGYRLYDLGGASDFFWAGAVSPDQTRVAIVGIASAPDVTDSDDGALLLLPTGATATAECDVTPPATWEAPDFAANAAVELALRMQLQALNTRMQRGEDETATATTVMDLNTLFDAGNPSLKNAMTREYAAVVSDIFDLFVPTVGQVLDPATTWDPTPETADVGGRYCGPSAMAMSGCWNMSTGGVDLRQVMEKGAYQAAMYRQAYLRASGTVTPATIDQIAALFGANASFDINGTNVHASNYAKGMGFYGAIRDHLIAAKAYAASDSCRVELNAELNAALLAWEQSQYARFVHYAHRAQLLFVAGTATAAQNAEALHWLGEGLGLVYGFKGLPNNARVITDAEIDEVLTLMKMPNVVDATLYELLVGDAEDIDDIEAVFDLVQDIYGFSDDQMDLQFRVVSPTAG